MSTFQPSDAHFTSKPAPRAPDALLFPCEQVAPLLTAHFDGEAGEREIQIVRNHLAACRRCAATWQGWQHTRFLLRSTPLPLPPVGLLTRILQACRLASLLPSRLPSRLPLAARRSRYANQSTLVSPCIASAIDELGTIGDVSHLPLGGFTWDDEWTPQPPPELQEAILRRTTRSTTQRTAKAGLELPVAMMVPLSPQHTHFSQLRKTNWPVWMRHGAAIAVPAMLLWVVLMPQTSQTSRTSGTIPSLRAQRAVRGTYNIEAARRGTLTVAQPVAARPTNVPSNSAPRAATRATAPLSGAVNGVRDLEATTGTNPKRDAIATEAPVQFASLSGASNSGPHKDQPSPTMLPARLAAKFASLPGTRRGIGFRPKISVGYARRAIGSPSGAVKSSLTAQGLDERSIAVGGVTPLHREDAENTAREASLATPRLVAHVENDEAHENSIDMHDALSEAPSWGDSRPDDVRNVVDAYAAALISDDAEAESSEANG